MNKLGYSFLGLMAFLLLFFFVNPGFAPKRQVLGSVGHSLITAKYHHALVLEGGGRAFQSQYNLNVICRATQYMGFFGSGTSVYRGIARIASKAGQDDLRYEEVLDLAVRSNSNSKRVLALAESIARIDSPEDEVMWQAAYDEMLARANFPSVEAAIASQESQ